MMKKSIIFCLTMFYFLITANAQNALYAVCETSGDDIKKEVKFETEPTIQPGLCINVLFQYTHTISAFKENGKAAFRTPELSINDGVSYPITVAGELAGEGFVSSGEVHELVFTGKTWEDKTALVRYKGSDVNGNYMKGRDGLITQWKKYKTSRCTINNYWTFSVPFVEIPCVYSSVSRYGDTSIPADNYSIIVNATTTQCQFGADTGCCLYAIGY
ncbi:MAG: hypothetical protein K2J81_04980 [Treponemataceae bacterium]|nr:hypothetical protein [Treponemataceae bacterium]